MKQLTVLILMAFLAVACSSDGEALKAYRQAQALAGQGDAPQALAQYRRAAALASADSLMAAVCGDMGDLLFDEGLQEEALKAYLRACEAHRRLSDSAAVVRDLCNIANVYRTREADDSCLVFFSEALQTARQQDDRQAVADIHGQMAGYYLWHQQYDEARQLLLPLLTDSQETLPGGLVFMAADLYRHTGPKDSARHFCHLLLGEEETGLRQMGHKWMAALLLDDGHTAEAAQHLEQYELLTDSLMEETDTEALRRASALYDYTERERQNAQLRQRVIVAVALAAVLALALAALLMYFSRRRMYYRLKLQRLEHLLAEFRQKSPEAANAQQQLLADTPIGRRLSRLLSDPNQPTMAEDDWQALEETIEQRYPGFLQRLLSFHSLSPHEQRISLLLKAGVSPLGIAQLLPRSKQAVSSTRSRLYAKVFGQKGSPAQWDEFIRSL